MAVKTPPERGDEIYGAVLDLLREVGYDSLTLAAVEARVRVGGDTLRRRWGNRARLVAAAVHRYECDLVTSVDTGSLRGDLHEIARIVGESGYRGGVVPVEALKQAMASHPELAAAVHEREIEPEMLRRVIERAVRRGEVSPDNPALDFGPELIIGAAYGRLAVEDMEADAAYLVRAMDASVLPALLRR
ncbi:MULTISPECIES: TetR-like C-terminal domain-containing protein [Streptomyces]|uniref:TetR-like C-terminal domain-containing protein n=1 Tax=Streptomyces TaxID=1883 RepID=UPI001C30A5AA|nr:TetR-like C-terminal domain-containing protein [Streptomyces sp. GbtcB7]